MKLTRIVDTGSPEHWSDCGHSIRAALDCFAPLAITIRAKTNGSDPRGAFEPRTKQMVR